jgi:hypothetical protein
VARNAISCAAKFLADVRLPSPSCEVVAIVVSGLLLATNDGHASLQLRYSGKFGEVRFCPVVVVIRITKLGTLTQNGFVVLFDLYPSIFVDMGLFIGISTLSITTSLGHWSGGKEFL